MIKSFNVDEDVLNLVEKWMTDSKISNFSQALNFILNAYFENLKNTVNVNFNKGE